MMLNNINNITLTDSLDDDIVRSLLTYHQLLGAVEPYCITNLKRLDAYIAGLTLYDNFVNESVDCANAPSRVYKADPTIRFRLANYIQAKRKRNEYRQKDSGAMMHYAPMPRPKLLDVTYSSLKEYVDYNPYEYVGLQGDICNIADFEELFTYEDLTLQCQLHSDMLLLSKIYMYIDKKGESL